MREELKELIEFFRGIPEDQFGDAVQMMQGWPHVKCAAVHLHYKRIEMGLDPSQWRETGMWKALGYAQFISRLAIYAVNDGLEGTRQFGETAKERVVNYLTAILKDCKDGEEDRNDSR